MRAATSPWLWAAVGIACIARFAYLDSDPKIEDWIGYITDEGRWVETARNLALFGDPNLYELSKMHLVLSPAFQALNFVVFKLVGVSFWSARLLTAASGAGILILSVLLLRRHVGSIPLLLGVVVLAAEPAMLGVGRVALPEMPSLFFSLLAFSVISKRKNSLAAAAGAGLLMALAIGMKATTVLMVPGFAVMVLFSGVDEPRRQRLLRCAAFLLGVGIPAALGLFAAMAVGVISPDALFHLAHLFRGFLNFTNPHGVLSRFLANPAMSSVNLLILGAWLCSWMWFFRNENRGTQLGRIHRLSGIWAISWLLTWGFLEYTPGRYFVHVVVPLVLNVVAGLSLWRIVGPARVLARIGELLQSSRVWVPVWLVLASAVILSDLAIDLAGMLGVPNDRLLYRLVAAAILVAAFAVGVHFTRQRPDVAMGFIAFPVFASLLWMAFDQVAVATLSDPAAVHALPLARLVILTGAAFYCFACLRTTSDPKTVWTGALGVALVFVGLVFQSAPILMRPTHSIRDASRAAESMLSDVRLVRSVGGGSLMLENKLHYRDQSSEGLDFGGVLNFSRRYRVVGSELERVGALRLTIHPRYDGSGSSFQLEPGVALVDVYRKR